MSKMSKRTKAAKLMKANETLFKCPICATPIEVVQDEGISCLNNHTFDFARQGYLYLLANESHTKYSKDLFIAREKVVMQSEFFKPLIEKVAQLITKHTMIHDCITVADMGCGEGSLLHLIMENVANQTDKKMTAIGLDIAKAGIVEAAKNYDNVMWFVADLAQPPLQNDSINVILNILSPSNYNSFSQVLVNDGLVIKVVPKKDYLQELRQYFDIQARENADDRVVAHFKNHFSIVDHVEVRYEKKLDDENLWALAEMTPLTWGVEANKLAKIIQSESSPITAEFDVLVGKNSILK